MPCSSMKDKEISHISHVMTVALPKRHQEIPAQHRSIVTYGAAIAGAPWLVAVQLLEEGTRCGSNRLGQYLQIKMSQIIHVWYIDLHLHHK